LEKRNFLQALLTLQSFFNSMIFSLSCLRGFLIYY